MAGSTNALFVYLMYHGKDVLTSNLEDIQQLFLQEPARVHAYSVSIYLALNPFPTHNIMVIRYDHFEIQQRCNTAEIPDMGRIVLAASHDMAAFPSPVAQPSCIR